MTGTDMFEIWLICGAISAVWHVVDEWWHHEIFERSWGDIFITDTIVAVLCLIAGPIGLAIKIWEKFFDPNNI